MLHRLVYLALPLSVLHFLWLDRDFIRVPLIYGTVVGILLLLWLPPLRRAIVRMRSRYTAPRPAPITPKLPD